MNRGLREVTDLDALTLFAIAVVGAVFWPINAETACGYYVAGLGWHPLFVAVLCAAGQSLTYLIFYYTGGYLVGRSPRLTRRVERTRERYAKHFERRFLGLTAVGATLGMPPMLVAAVLAPGFQVPAHRFLLIAFAGRTLRFAAIAATAAMVVVPALAG